MDRLGALGARPRRRRVRPRDLRPRAGRRRSRRSRASAGIDAGRRRGVPRPRGRRSPTSPRRLAEAAARRGRPARPSAGTRHDPDARRRSAPALPGAPVRRVERDPGAARSCALAARAASSIEAVGPRARRRSAAGYEAMRLVLDADRSAGGRDRRRVIAAGAARSAALVALPTRVVRLPARASATGDLQRAPRARFSSR